MAIPSRFTKVKIAAGYTLLLVVLLFSLLFVHREMEKLSDTDDVQSLQTDSLLLLLKEKDENTIRMLQIINEANESMITPVELDSIICRAGYGDHPAACAAPYHYQTRFCYYQAKKEGFF